MRWAVAALRLEGPPGGRRGRPPPPTPPAPPSWLSEPAALVWPELPPAGLGPLACHLRPRRGAVAGSRPNFCGGRGPLAPPPAPRPAPGPHANTQVQQPMVGRAGPALPHRSQWARAGGWMPRPPPRGPSRARPARSFPHVGLGAGPPPAGRGRRALRRSEAPGAAPPPAGAGGSIRGATLVGPGGGTARLPRTAASRPGLSRRPRAPGHVAWIAPWRPPPARASGLVSGAVWLRGRGLRPGLDCPARGLALGTPGNPCGIRGHERLGVRVWRGRSTGRRALGRLPRPLPGLVRVLKRCASREQIGSDLELSIRWSPKLAATGVLGPSLPTPLPASLRIRGYLAPSPGRELPRFCS